MNKQVSMFSVRIAFVYFLFSLSVLTHAQSRSFCGSIDFTSISNLDLFNITFINKVPNGENFEGVQCGLIGEKLPLCSSCRNELPEESMIILRKMLGQKAHIDWHSKWHKIRSRADSISTELFNKLQNKGLIPENIQREEFFSKYKMGGSLAGENFFYMHRMMIKMVQFELSNNNKPCISPWKSLPTSIDDKFWPVPKKYTTNTEKEKDKNRLITLKRKLRKYKNNRFLRKISLNKLGTLLESELHQDLHEFYRSNPYNSPEALAQGFNDDLLPVETSPVNKYFWKIHGLVDEILGNWLSANSYSQISLDCLHQNKCYQWEANWVGKYPKLK